MYLRQKLIKYLLKLVDYEWAFFLFPFFLYFPNFLNENYSFQLGKSTKVCFKIICSQ